MKQIKVLGSGCKKCNDVAELITTTAQTLGIEVEVSKESSPEAIMGYGVMRTPGVVIDETVVHAGSIPDTSAIEGWLKR